LRLATQLAIGTALLLAIGGGAVTYHRYQADGEAAAAVRGARAIAVEVATAESGTVRERIEAVGSSLARQAVDIVALSSGRVAEIHFTPGEHVEEGAVLIRLDDLAEQADVAEADAMRREAELALDRARKLRTNNTVAQATVDELEAAYAGTSARLDGTRKELTDRTVRAPFAGVVGIRGVDIGARVDDDTVLTTLDDLAEIEIEFSVPELFYGAIRAGQTVGATSSAFPNRRFEGKIATIDSRIDEVARAFRVRAIVPNPDLELPAGMFMHVEVILGERPAVLSPEQAVIAAGADTFVFTIEDGTARRRDVRLGQRDFGEVEVLEGLSPGEAVVVSGVQRLRDGVPVEVQGGDAGTSGPQRAGTGGDA
jgi:membrane fusion protein (multidrug efflux system)